MKNNNFWVPGALPFFLFGVLYYLVTPVFVQKLISDNNSLLNTANKFIGKDYFNVFYFIDVFLILFFFSVGFYGAKKINFKKNRLLDHFSNDLIIPKFVFILFFIFFLFLVLRAAFSGANFFSGYSDYNILVLGPFASTVFLSAWFCNYFSRKIILLLFRVVFLLSAVILIGLGSRMFFVLGLITLLLGVISRNDKFLKVVRQNIKLRIKHYIALGLLLILGIIIFVSVGIYRQANSGISAESFIGVFFAEPFFGTTSSAIYLDNIGKRPLINIPYDLIASIVNFIPSFIYPDKVKFLSDFTYDVNKASPFGGQGLIGNLYSNFGMAYPLYILFVGVFYGYLHRKALSSTFFRATYFSVLPLLMFHFFRDGLVTVVKVMFFNVFIFPMFLIFLLFILFKKQSVTY